MGRDLSQIASLLLHLAPVLALHVCTGSGPRVRPGARDPAILATRAELAIIQDLLPGVRNRSVAVRSSGARIATPRIPGDTAAIAPDRWWRTR